MYFMNDVAMEVPGRVTDRTVHRLLRGGRDEPGHATFTVHRWPVAPGADVEELAARSERSASRRLVGYRLHGRSRREAAGLPVVEMRFTWSRDNEDVYAREAHLVAQDVWLLFAARGGLDASDVCDAAIERVIQSFRVRA